MSLTIRIVITLFIAIWLAGIFIEWLIPIIPQSAFLIPFLEKSYSLVCHQQQNKLIGDSLYHSLVCSRCAGIYVGFFSSSFVGLFNAFKKEPAFSTILLAAFFMLSDVLLYSFGVYNYSKSLAFITGLLLGSVGFLYFYSAIKKLILELNSKKN